MQWALDTAQDHLADHARDDMKVGFKYLLKLFRHDDETDQAKSRPLKARLRHRASLQLGH